MDTSKEEVSLLDSSLTSLSWLQNLRVHDLISPPSLVGSMSPSPDRFSSSPQDNNHCRTTYGISLSPIKKCLLQSADFKKHPRKYSANRDKPPYSYSTLLYLAIVQSKSGKATLNEIYRWIKDNFLYYRYADAGWQNSIRHNLSLNELFCKVPRTHGKGNHWKINPDYHHLLEDNTEYYRLDHRRNSCSKLRTNKLKGTSGRKRSHSQSDSHGGQHRMRGLKHQRTEGTSTDVCGMPGDLDWMALLGSQRRPVFGSPDMPHVTEAALNSPLVFPATTAAIPSEIPATPSTVESHGSLLEEVVLKQDSPSPQVLLPWAEKNSQSPNSSSHLHPWAESKESTMHGLKNLCKRTKSLGGGATTNHTHPPVWSPEQSWSSSSTNGFSITALTLKT